MERSVVTSEIDTLRNETTKWERHKLNTNLKKIKWGIINESAHIKNWPKNNIIRRRHINVPLLRTYLFDGYFKRDRLHRVHMIAPLNTIDSNCKTTASISNATSLLTVTPSCPALSPCSFGKITPISTAQVRGTGTFSASRCNLTFCQINTSCFTKKFHYSRLIWWTTDFILHLLTIWKISRQMILLNVSTVLRKITKPRNKRALLART